MRVKSAVKRDLTEAVERLRVKKESSLDYETYKRLKVKIGLQNKLEDTERGNLLKVAVINGSVLFKLEITLLQLSVRLVMSK